MLALALATVALAATSSSRALGQTTESGSGQAGADAYADQSDAEALATAREQFDGLLDAPPLKWPPVHPGEELRGYLSDQAAVVSGADGGRGIVESTLPLRGETPEGETASIDLGLIDVGSTFAPKSSAVDVRIPDDSTGQLRFPDQSFGVRLAGADAQSAVVESNKAFYANVVKDGDLVLEPQPAGAELSVVLRSPDAPTVLPLRFDLGGDQTLHVVDAGESASLPPGAVEVRQGGDAVGVVYPALAFDTDGHNVPVQYRLDGDQVVMDVDTSGDPSWPVLVDPPIGIYDNNGTSTSNPDGYVWKNWKAATSLDPPDATNPTSNGYSYCNNQSTWPLKKFYLCQGTLNGTREQGGPLYVKANASVTAYASSDWAEWYKTARLGSYIYQFDATAISSATSAAVTGGNHGQFFMGVTPGDPADAVYGWETGRVVHDGITDEGLAATGGGTNVTNVTRYVKVHDGQPTNATPIGPGNRALFRLQMETTSSGPGSPLPYIAIGGGATYSSETSPPTLSTPSHTQAVQGGWVTSYADTVSATAQDTGVGTGTAAAGLGIGTIALSRSGVPSGSANACPLQAAPANTSSAGLAGAYDSCPLSYTGSITYTAPEGVDSYVLSATDLVGNHNGAEDEPWTVKVDNSAPSISSLSGPLYDDRTVADDDGDGQTDVDDSGSIRSDESITVSATDGVASTGLASGKRSGIASIEMDVDGHLLHPADRHDASCTTTGCPYDGPTDKTFTLHPSDFAASGDHTVTIVVRDQLASSTSTTAGTHISTQSFDVYVDKDQTVVSSTSSAIGEDDAPAPIDDDVGLSPELSTQQEADVTAFITTEAANPLSDLNHVLGLSPYTIESIGPRTGNGLLIGAFVVLDINSPRDIDAIVPALAGLGPTVTPYRAHFVGTGVTDLALWIDFPLGTSAIANIEPGPESGATTYGPVPGTPPLPPPSTDD
jgi:hypothetical protein